MKLPDVAALRAQVKADQEALRGEYADHGDARRLLVSRCARVDDVLTRL